MDYLTAMQKSRPREMKNLSPMGIALYSNWDSKVLEVFLSAYAIEKGLLLKPEPNGYGSLLMDLERLVENTTADPSIPLIVILDEEVFTPGFSLRSDALLSRERIEKSLSEAESRIQHFTSIITQLASVRRILLLSLPVPGFPLLSTPRWVESRIVLTRHRLGVALSQMQASNPHRITVLDSQQIFDDIPLSQILDDRLLFSGGWPFNVKATDCVAKAITETLLVPMESRKLLITDADQTLWRGVVGDDGADAISWAQEAETYRHFIYQKTLNLFMSEGVLVALASKNSPESLTTALSRSDLILEKKGLASTHASWSPKSEMISAILSKTNLLPSSVVFVDDSEFELGEVQAAFPDIKCLQFPNENSGLRSFLQNLRSSFDTRTVTDEDKARSSSVKHAADFQKNLARTTSVIEYLSSLDMRAKIEPINLERSDRAFQLVNKSNQFNLSGRRFSEIEWKAFVSSTDRTAYQLHFQDKHSDYGVVSVLIANNEGHITDWILSCRVFGRTIEHYMLNVLTQQFQKSGITILQLHYQDTGKNLVTRTFLNDHAKHSNGIWTVDGHTPLTTFVSPS
jgi:FkbH-like protein